MMYSCNQIRTFSYRYLTAGVARLASVIIALLVSSSAFASDAVQTEPDIERLQQIMQGQVSLMKPELQKKVQALSPKTKKSLMKILAQHSRYSDTVTMRQVMTEVLSDYQSMVAGIMTENPEQTADSARRLANHRIPVGGLLPYLGLDNINDERLAVLEAFNDSVEGNARKLAAAADNGDMDKAASLLGDIGAGCVACHSIFRSQPGKSELLR